MPKPEDVAEWMLDQVTKEGFLFQFEATSAIAQKFWAEFVYSIFK